MKRIMLTLSLFFCCIWALAQPTAPVTLIAEMPPGEHIFVNYQDEFLDVKKLRFQRDSISGKYLPLQFFTTHPLLLKFNKHMQQYPVHVAPGDTLYIQVYPEGPAPYSFHGKRAGEYNFFVSLDKQGCGMGYIDTFGLDRSKGNFPNHLPRFKALRDQRLALLEKASDSLHFSQAFTAYARNEIQGQYYQALLSPYWDPKHGFAQFPPSYVANLPTSEFEAYFTQHELIASSFLYKGLAVSYVRFLSRDALDTPDEFKSMYQQASRALQGKTRDYVLFYLLKQHNDKDLDSFEDFRKDFSSVSSYQPYVHYLDSLAERKAKLAFTKSLREATLQTLEGKSLTWQQLLDQNQGKGIYIDLWASWCAPCLAEMPASKRLQASLKDRDLAFVYISIDVDTIKWSKALEKYELQENNGQHYLLDPSSELAKFLNAPPIPRYVLIDKKGRAVSLDAKRPSHPQLIQDLLKVLR